MDTDRLKEEKERQISIELALRHYMKMKNCKFQSLTYQAMSALSGK
ncbi:selenocysteine-specific translation elongation factor [Mesobacillus boroniphilus JCM 21738]|uniref:Selenocysteine-specific translation elongation factor n=1 Tax=Mesobacillus boroniphilus JCM 21738 TaxID=1294265 RepID=W4RJQ0_9BACI|nr:selenocysteine-specific translation elongation factor [Mesobacillus boroniphilus JCM 21738]